jgi:hypothetical protein
MPIANVQVLEQAQVKSEGTRGTAEATMTRWLYFVQGGLNWTYEIPMDETKEALRSYYGTELVDGGIPVVRLNCEVVLSYEELVWWLTMCLGGGGLTGTDLTGTPNAYGYEFDPDGLTDDLKTFTIKAGDGSTNYRCSRCVVNRAVFRWNPQSGGEAHWRLALEIMAHFEGATSFDSISDHSRTKILARGTRLYSDAVGGTLGTTQVAAKLRSGNITIDNQIEEKLWSENTASTADDFARGEQIITAELLAEFNSDTEFGYFRAGTRRMLRILQTGAVISGSNPYTSRWDLFRAHIVSFVPGRTGQNRTATIGIVGEIDRGGSVPAPLEAYVINADASIAA